MYLSCFISFKLSRYIMCQILLRFGMSFQSVIITKFIKIDTVVSLLKRNDRQRDYSIHTNIANDNITLHRPTVHSPPTDMLRNVQLVK